MQKSNLLVLALNILIIKPACTLNNPACANYTLPKEYLNQGRPAYLELNNYKYHTESLPANLRYLNEYKIAASGQFNEPQFRLAIKNTPGIIDVDLRSEFHGFSAGLPFSWIDLPNDNINAGKGQALILAQESVIFASQPSSASLSTNASGLEFYIANLKVKPTSETPKLCLNAPLLSEAQLMSKLHLPYYRITITDHLNPNPENIDRVVELYEHYLHNQPQQWIYLHCQGGEGRTTTVTAMLLMLKQQSQGKLQPLPQLLTQVEKASKYKLVPECSRNDDSYRCQGKWARYDSITNFYQYVQQRQTGLSYSQWLQFKK